MTPEAVRTLFIVLVLGLIVTDVSVHSAEWCPSFCVCDTWYELQHASCTGRHLYSIHTGVPSNVQALDLSNNSISVLRNYELTEAGLSKLKYLNLSVNAISEIGLNAFDALSELTVLDLSQNHLYYLLSDVFMPAKNLRILRLSKNNFNSHVPRLECPWLTDLALDSCQISHIPVDTFDGLSQLRNLDLSNNLMIQLDSLALRTLRFLRKLSIEGNPWSCDKLTQDLQIYLTRRSVQYSGVCAKNVPEPKKFEKMVVYDPRKHRPLIIPNSNVQKDIVTKKNFTSTMPIPQNTTICANETNITNLTKILNAISPFWFFAVGLLLGSACGMFTCYVWLTRKISCCRGHRGRRNSDIQRVSLLQNLWQYEDSAFNEDTSCPGTPPPPYREVMLRPGLYRTPSATRN